MLATLSIPTPPLYSSKPTITQYITRFIASSGLRDRPGGQLGLRPNSVRNYISFQRVWERFVLQSNKDITFLDLGREQVNNFKHWLLIEQEYSQNHAGRLIGTLKTLCLDAQKNDIKTHSYVNFISGFAQTTSQKIIHTLNFEELNQVAQLQLENPTLVNVQKWLIIGFWIGQRVSDLLTLKPEQIRPAKNGGIYVDILQQKTQKNVTVGIINTLAIKILTEGFPKRIASCRFNKHLKEVLRLAEIDEPVTAYRYNGKLKRKEHGVFPKYAIITSHDLRRSFATNFFGKIPTPILMNMTGHSRETTFMSYIGKDQNRDRYADEFMQGMSAIEM
ncbi:site-specific integrase [Flavobacteriaceae bacterium]|nr:site-specific integrase [Flavobacteriaceae bacterium]